MELMQAEEEAGRAYSDSREELEEEEEAAAAEEESTGATRLRREDAREKLRAREVDLMELSLGRSSGGGGEELGLCEKEHMFDKVVTPSDVGKLNRLVIPKQHAEKYFPLDSGSSDKGLLLNFEDRSGKLWRFRYSYWNSSQSYVMTKGWSRFVKEKRLDAGDVVSFQRGRGDLHRHRLYIDWRARPPHHLHHHHHHHLIAPFFPQPRHLNYANMYPFHHHHRYTDVLNSSSSLRPPPGLDARLLQQQVIIDSVPVPRHHQNHYASGTGGGGGGGAGKRLRLFGVNMECGSSTAQDVGDPSPPPPPPPPLQPLQLLRATNEDQQLSSSSSSSRSRFGDLRRGDQAAILFGLDPSLQYRQ